MTGGTTEKPGSGSAVTGAGVSRTSPYAATSATSTQAAPVNSTQVSPFASADSAASDSAALDAAAGAEDDPVERVLARGRAYLAWGAAHPGLYQVMYEGRLQSEPEQDPSVVPPGRAQLYKVRDDVRAAMTAGAVPEGDADALAIQLWALVHGLVSLRANKPGVPWPDTAKLATDAGRRILRAP